ncbi:uncharacterized protein [Asterias amurensis]|uniref:uncharacterized protein n=1 Tax=Asterias amurensis TaxID=7602 RepID=UPI003AB5BF19
MVSSSPYTKERSEKPMQQHWQHWKNQCSSYRPITLLSVPGKDLHDSSTSTVRVGNISCPFLSTSGVHQGCVLAPALFCCAIDWVLNHCQANLGIMAGETSFTDLAYADDAALFTREPNEWPTKLQKFEEEAGTMGLHTSWAKTKIQNCAGLGPPSVPGSVDGQPVETTDKFRYLGCDICSEGHSSPDINRRLGLAS